MNDQEKSVMLAKAMGWEVADGFSKLPPRMITKDDVVLWGAALYDPANMALAWRVLIFGFDLDEAGMVTTFTDWYDRHAIRIARNPDGQRLWLDKIVELIQESGWTENEPWQKMELE